MENEYFHINLFKYIKNVSDVELKIKIRFFFSNPISGFLGINLEINK